MHKEVQENQDGSGTHMEEVVHLCGWAWLLEWTANEKSMSLYMLRRTFNMHHQV